MCQVLSGVVTAADPAHRAYEKFVEDEIFTPLGMTSCSIGSGVVGGLGFLQFRSKFRDQFRLSLMN